MFRKWTNERGFTLTELMIVIVVLGVLAALVLPRFVGRTKQSRLAAAKADIEANLSTALELYELDNGHFPSNAQGLRALLVQPDSDPVPTNWNGPWASGPIPSPFPASNRLKTPPFSRIAVCGWPKPISEKPSPFFAWPCRTPA